jgi:hypothetical protein
VKGGIFKAISEIMKAYFSYLLSEILVGYKKKIARNIEDRKDSSFVLSFLSLYQYIYPLFSSHTCTRSLYITPWILAALIFHNIPIQQIIIEHNKVSNK